MLHALWLYRSGASPTSPEGMIGLPHGLADREYVLSGLFESYQVKKGVVPLL